ncbi:hypothetical protein [Flavobacterium urocaniciphilum]|uniref:Membrane domain of glycerophosphoryl diester phosphodiesterase n=1 Tax=Flavobacterium urocaniciphilum TaxID=1299341 RepID=A0A1H8YZ84_9FLAO|nr:hypothetical protein [Flavobacterium urocaniciphilum]SEP57510.1 hypothetical protein SAMN05444005_101382 [Flavobacterium urocaniciphilum]
MFQLYKNRNFNEIIGDTFNFFKIHGKNYFANYLAINGGILLVLIVLLYFFMKVFYDGLFANGTINNNLIIENYFEENLTLFIGYGIGAFVLILILTLISHLYPIAYLKLIEKNEETNTKNLWNFIQSKLGKSIVFFLLTGITMLPICIALLFLCMLLFFIIVGIPLLMLVFPAMLICLSFAYYNYISTNDGYFTSISKGYKLFIKKPWPLIGSTMIIYMIVNTVVTVISFIPYFAGIFSLLFNIETQKTENLPESFTFIMVMVALTFILSISLNYLLQNIIFVNQGIMYYTRIDETENTSKLSEIDLIGSNEE